MPTRRSWLLGRLPKDGRRRAWLSPLGFSLMLAIGLWLSFTIELRQSNPLIIPGLPSPSVVQAPRAVRFISEVRTEEERARAERRTENLVYTSNFDLPAQQRVALSDLFGAIENVRSDPTLTPQQQVERLSSLPNATLAISPTLAQQLVNFSATEWNALQRDTLSVYDRALENQQFEIDEAGLDILQKRAIPLWTSGLPLARRDIVRTIVPAFLRVNRVLDQATSDQRRTAARDAVEPVEVQLQPGEIIVRTGETVTPFVVEKLQVIGELRSQTNIEDLLGMGLLALLLAITYISYMGVLQPDTIRIPRRMNVIIGLIVVSAIVARLVIPLVKDDSYIFPFAAVGLVIALAFNGHIALASTGLICIAIGIQNDNTLNLSVTYFLGNVVAILIARTQGRTFSFLRAGISVFLVTSCAQIAFRLLSPVSTQINDWPWVVLFSAVNGLFAAILSLGLLTLIGRLAGVVTPLQLMELAHPSQALLRRLMREAPGTHAHSVAVGNLAEAAAEQIGGDALLLRVGAYYHDIGKVIRPYFFTDNQTGRENVHNDLDPHTSAQIIIDHVREGAVMAREARLPQPIIDFILTHHGTSLVQHFYNMALQEEESVNEEDFRYPGPKPSTREQGVLMLADSVEATTRAKAQHGKLAPSRVNAEQPSPPGTQTIEEVVNSIIDERVRSGQLDNASLTMRDLQLIKQAFVNSLQGLYHPRVDYATLKK